MGNCGLSPFGKKTPPTEAPAPEAQPEKTEVVAGETSETTETEVKAEVTPTGTVTTETTPEIKEVTAKVETSTVEAEKKEATTA